MASTFIQFNNHKEYTAIEGNPLEWPYTESKHMLYFSYISDFFGQLCICFCVYRRGDYP